MKAEEARALFLPWLKKLTDVAEKIDFPIVPWTRILHFGNTLGEIHRTAKTRHWTYIFGLPCDAHPSRRDDSPFVKAGVEIRQYFCGNAMQIEERIFSVKGDWTMRQERPLNSGSSASPDKRLQALLQHMLGAWPDDPGPAGWGRRNYFMTGPGKVDDAFRELVAAGMAYVGSRIADNICIYHATEKGCRAIGLNAVQVSRAIEAARQSASIPVSCRSASAE
jgi:hypothetical protein